MSSLVQELFKWRTHIYDNEEEEEEEVEEEEEEEEEEKSDDEKELSPSCRGKAVEEGKERKS